MCSSSSRLIEHNNLFSFPTFIPYLFINPASSPCWLVLALWSIQHTFFFATVFFFIFIPSFQLSTIDLIVSGRIYHWRDGKFEGFFKVRICQFYSAPFPKRWIGLNVWDERPRPTRPENSHSTVTFRSKICRWLFGEVGNFFVLPLSSMCSASRKNCKIDETDVGAKLLSTWSRMC